MDVDNPAAERFASVLAALGRDEADRAAGLAEAALKAGEEHPLYLNLSAFRLEQSGDLHGALARLGRALELAPNDVLVLTAIGRTLSQLGRDRDALAYFDAAIAVHPRHAPAYNGRGLSLTALGDDQEGRRAQLIAADLDPNFPDPLGALADHALREDRPDVARNLAERALKLQPDQPAAALVIASLDGQAGRRDAALHRVERLLNSHLAPMHRSAAEQVAGEQLDALGRPEEAMAAFGRAKGILRGMFAELYERADVETATGLTRRLGAYFTEASPNDWLAAGIGEAQPNVKGHVFLVGFVRSGTTLLEQVLASHPDVTALEEKATLRAVAAPYFDSNEGLDRLRSLGPASADALRADYWARVRAFGVEPSGRVFVDKAPLSTLWLPMVAKLFPEAKVLLAIRDPRDVVVSAFRHRFLVNALAWPFTDLVDTARFYDGVMRLAELYRGLLPTPVHQHRHEDLVENFDREVGAICDFVGLSWTDSLRDFAETAKNRDVQTPSRDQVRRGLNREGVGRWRLYGNKVDSILPVLEPWVERYSYEP